VFFCICAAMSKFSDASTKNAFAALTEVEPKPKVRFPFYDANDSSLVISCPLPT
jgi:hypothetical protein